MVLKQVGSAASSLSETVQLALRVVKDRKGTESLSQAYFRLKKPGQPTLSPKSFKEVLESAREQLTASDLLEPALEALIEEGLAWAAMELKASSALSTILGIVGEIGKRLGLKGAAARIAGSAVVGAAAAGTVAVVYFGAGYLGSRWGGERVEQGAGMWRTPIDLHGWDTVLTTRWLLVTSQSETLDGTAHERRYFHVEGSLPPGPDPDVTNAGGYALTNIHGWNHVVELTFGPIKTHGEMCWAIRQVFDPARTASTFNLSDGSLVECKGWPGWAED